jgi:apolipoprotein N-acyltransferase
MTRQDGKQEARGRGRREAWMRVAGCIGTVLLLAFAITHPSWWPLAAVALVPFLVVVTRLTPLRAGGISWCMALLTILLSTGWWGSLLQRFGGMSWPTAVLSAMALCAYQALPYGLWGLLCSFVARRSAVLWLVAAPLLWVVAECVAPFSFKPYLAVTASNMPALPQLAELGGPPAVSALVVLVNLTVLELGVIILQKRRPSRGLLVAALVIVAGIGLGAARTWQVNVVRERAEAVRVGVLQPNFGVVSAERRQRYGRLYVDALRKATDNLAAKGAELIVWPETSWPYVLDRKMQCDYPPGHPWQLCRGGSYCMLVGSLTHEFQTSELDLSRVYNSAVLIGTDGTIVGTYDKNHLVPFAEYIPFRDRYPDWAERMRERLPDWPELLPGEEPAVLTDGVLRIGPLICSEDLDTHLAAKLAELEPNILICIASDAWFGDTVAPRQHLALAAFRAIETRRELVRVSNTGLSAHIDATGRIRRQGTLHDVDPDEPPPPETFIVDVPLLDISTPFLRFHKLIPWICGFAVFVVATVQARRQRRERRRQKSRERKKRRR